MSAFRLRATVSIAALCLFVTAAYTALFFLVSYLTLPDSAMAVQQKVKQAFESGDLQLDPYPAFDTRIGRHQHNDCLILSFFFMPYPSHIEQTVSPIAPFAGNACAVLHDLAQGNPTSADTAYYHRYLHGHRIVAAALVERLGVGGARAVLYYTCYGILLFGTAAFLVRYASYRGSHRSAGSQNGPNGVEDLAAAAILLPFLLFYGLPYYGMSFSHAPADISLFLFLVAGLWVNLLSIPTTVFIISITTFAVFTAFFEFFTGGAPIGLAALIGVLVINSLRIRDVRRLYSRLLSGTAVYIVAFIGVFAIKVIAASIVFGPDVVLDFAGQLKTRMTGDFADSIDVEKARAWGFDPAGHETYSLFSIFFLAAKMLYSSSYLAYGSLMFGGLLLTAAVSIIVFVLIRQWRRGRDQIDMVRLVGLAASAALIPAWYVLFLNHSIIHASFMIRISTWIIAAAAAMVVIACASDMRRVRSPEKVIAA